MTVDTGIALNRTSDCLTPKLNPCEVKKKKQRLTECKVLPHHTLCCPTFVMKITMHQAGIFPVNIYFFAIPSIKTYICTVRPGIIVTVCYHAICTSVTALPSKYFQSSIMNKCQRRDNNMIDFQRLV